MRTTILILAIQTTLSLSLLGEDGLFVVAAMSTWSDGRSFEAQVLQVTPTVQLTATLLTAKDGGVDALFVDAQSRWIFATSYYPPVVLVGLPMDHLDSIQRVTLAERPWLVDLTHLLSPPGKKPNLLFERVTDVGREPDRARRLFGAVNVSEHLELSALEPPLLDDLKNIRLSGMAGLADMARPDTLAFFPIDGNGRISTGRLYRGAELPIELPDETRSTSHNRDAVINSRNDQKTVVTVYEHDGIRWHRWTDFAWVFSEQSKTWKKVGIGNDEAPEIRGFGPWFVVMGKAAPDETSKTPEMIRKATAKHRNGRSLTGPDLRDFFGTHWGEYTGELRIFNANSAAEWRLKTDNENSEVLLIDGETMIYRVGREIWSARLTAVGKISEQKKLASDSRLEDAHWAFYSAFSSPSPRGIN